MAGPDAAARKTGGGGGGSTGGGGSSGGGGTTTPPSSSATFNTVTVRWDPLNPPSGDTSTPTDSYFTQQWGLTNATAGIDVVKAWQNYTGAGVKVGVVDDGFDYNHPDIKPNYQGALDYDARTGTNDAFGDPTADKHGTTVMGVIGAARDGSGVVGVAYHAGEAGFRIGFGSSGSTSQIADAFNHLLSSGMDVANNSWQYTTAYSDNFSLSGFSTIKSSMANDVANGRGGLGIDFVFAAGNGRDSGDNVNYHNLQNNPYAITVAATDTYGHVTSYSSPGAALLISAPGKAYTDDRAGSYGYTSGDYINISGTSYAAPYVSGVVALMLQANPDLGYRDVMEILAYSARNSDTASLSWQTNGAHDWNGGGLHFSHDYGFGMVDAWSAVRLAESWQKQSTYADMSNVTVVHSDNLAIADGGSVSSTISETYDLWLDKVLVDLNISHGSPSDLTVTLTSPSGTTAVLVDHPTNGTGSGIVFEASANTFWGENAKGAWTLTVTDSVAGNSGTLNGWTLQALGDAPTTPTVYVYTDEFAAASGTARGVLNDASGSAGINTAAVSTGSWLDLNAGAQDTIAGRTLQIGSGTVLKSVWGGDGNDTIVANGAGDLIEAGRGNDTVTAGTGGDRIWGGPGSDTFVFKALPAASATIGDFAPGADVIDLHQLLAAVGYRGTDAVADGWVALAADSSGTGTNIAVDAHAGQGAQLVVDVVGVSPDQWHKGVDLLAA